jgi:uncharacterized protein YndB with AHSA1/START domain
MGATMAESLPPIVLVLETRATPEEAWAALTEPERIAEWFTDASKLGAVGDGYRLDFGDGSLVEGIVTSLEPGRRFAHTWIWTNAEPYQETLVTWSVEPMDDGGCRITLTHDGWAEAGLDETARSDHEGYWSGYLDDLASVLNGEG